MNRDKTLSVGGEKTAFLLKFFVLISIATLAPLAQNQFITGTVVNATLFVSTALLGVQVGILIGLFPSLIALSVGLLPFVLAPMIPFIIIGNLLLVMTFGRLEGKNYLMRIVLASVLKFGFLFAMSFFVVDIIMKSEVASKVAVMLSWPQLVTALAGGVVSLIFIKKR